MAQQEGREAGVVRRLPRDGGEPFLFGRRTTGRRSERRRGAGYRSALPAVIWDEGACYRWRGAGRMAAMSKVRPWLVGAACIACGLVARVVFWLHAPPGSRAEAASHACFLAPRSAAGLLLVTPTLWRPAYQAGGPSRAEFVGCLLWLVLALISLFAVGSTLGS